MQPEVPRETSLQRLTRDVEQAMRERYAQRHEEEIARGARHYRRAYDLPHVLRDVTAQERLDRGVGTTVEIIRRLRAALTAAQKSYGHGRWTGDHNRVVALKQALRAEEMHLDKMLVWGRG